ncbi:protochlorophyllide-dependent translocon component 52, chloroplastic-like [Chenopodium quinoa]|uniref:protochlorophyllide-dependent translocon component 52, chloroplastic-like n=1 Tax=Chenopodium quinoa TaxID=63459 RepID=UPI000B77717F|nr:protochlorophyllide-dependent translocon component 52, chloroplastic-like [Chenopodium quinoa]
MAHLSLLSTSIPNLTASPIYIKLLSTRSRKSTRQLLSPSSDSTWLPYQQYSRLSNNKSNSTTKRSEAVSAYSTEKNIKSPNQQESEVENEAAMRSGDKFKWYDQWCPVMPVCDLDIRKPHGKMVMGLNVVVWWDRTKSEWKVFDDLCPHRLAPLSEGRIDQSGRLQCVYHGWCFDASGRCKLIPQAPPDGPPVESFTKACVAVYPSTVQNGIVWFWPNSDPEFKDVLQKKRPPFFPELDDPSYSHLISNRDINYGYEFLIENLMDPAHVPYAHYGILKAAPPDLSVDKEGGKPLNMGVKHLDINGFSTKLDWGGTSRFFAPFVYYVYPNPSPYNGNGPLSSVVVADEDSSPAEPSQRRAILIFLCVPISPGKSRLIWSFPRNFEVWMDQIIPRWVFHLKENLILDSDLYLLHLEERKIKELGPINWHKVCYVPTKADSLVAAFRRWFNEYSEGQVDWGSKFNGGALPPTPPREELLDRYWTHVVNCSSCNAAYKGLNVAELALQVMAFGLIGVVGLTKQGMMTTVQRSGVFLMAILCFATSKWLSVFIYKNFRYHDYNHVVE